MYYEHFEKILLYFIAGVIILYSLLHGGYLKSDISSGRGFSLKFPPGWVIDSVNSSKPSFTRHEEEPETIVYHSLENYPKTQIPLAIISVYSIKLTEATWIQDEFPTILDELKGQGYKIIDRGEIRLDNLISEWVLYEDPQAPRLNLDFYAVDDTNMFYKLQYSTHPDAFKLYREAFEATRASFKFSKLAIEQQEQL